MAALYLFETPKRFYTARLAGALLASAGAFSLCFGPASAQYGSDFSLAKVVRQGITTKPINGAGTVVVQIRVNADASHHVTKILSSSNAGDNAAAIELAETATYAPAHRGTTPVASFYDFTFRFDGNGRSVSGVTPVRDRHGVVEMIKEAMHAGAYRDAAEKATLALQASPHDTAVLQLLGVARYYEGHLKASADAFSRAKSIDQPFVQLAAQAFVTSAAHDLTENPQLALAYARRAVQLQQTPNARLVLGTAELANHDYNGAIATLSTLATGADRESRTTIDRNLVTAYLATGDTARAMITSDDLARVNPCDDSTREAIGNYYMRLGGAAMEASDYQRALASFNQAALAGTAKIAAGANADAAFAIMKMRNPDYIEAERYATKAVAAQPNDVAANFALGVALAGSYLSNKDGQTRAKALQYLAKADRLAKAAGKASIVKDIEAQIHEIAP